MTEPRRLRRARPVSDLSVNQLSLAELHAEFQRRVQNLIEQREELRHKIEIIERELVALGSIGESAIQDNGEAAPRRRRRRVNAVSLTALLADVLEQKPLTTREAAEAALERGYVTTSRNFRNNVSVALNRDRRFTKEEDGRWAVVHATESTESAE